MSKKKKKSFRGKDSFFKKIDYAIKETKLAQISRIRVVRDVHMLDNINPEKFEKKKQEMTELVASNNQKYPKSEAILVRRRKDEEDKRRVVYHLEDGLRRYMIAQELGIDDIYVSIIEEAE